jgi:hypothetical protein
MGDFTSHLLRSAGRGFGAPARECNASFLKSDAVDRIAGRAAERQPDRSGPSPRRSPGRNLKALLRLAAQTLKEAGKLRNKSMINQARIDRNISGGVMLMRSQPEISPLERPRCKRCQTRMMLSRLEPEGDGSQKRTFECSTCGFIETRIVPDPLHSDAVLRLADNVRPPN